MTSLRKSLNGRRRCLPSTARTPAQLCTRVTDGVTSSQRATGTGQDLRKESAIAKAEQKNLVIGFVVPRIEAVGTLQAIDGADT